MIQIQLVKHVRDQHWRPRMLLWPDLVALLTTHERRGEITICPGGHEIKIDGIGQTCPGGETITTGKDGPGFSPCVADDGSTRSNVSVRAMSLAVLDLDGIEGEGIEPNTFNTILDQLEASNLSCVVYTSHRHTATHCKARFVFQPDRNIFPIEWPIIRAHLIRKFGLGPTKAGQNGRPDLSSALADMTTKDLSRFYYLPSSPVGGVAFAAELPGALLNVDEVIEAERLASINERARVELHTAEDRFANIERAREANDEPTDLDGLRNMMRATKGDNRPLIQAMLRGEKLANTGGRDTTLNHMIAAIRYSVPANTPTEAILQLLTPSLLKFDVEIDELTGRREDWIETAREKLDRHQARRMASDAVKAAIAHDTWTALRAEAARVREPTPRAPRAVADDKPGASDEEPDDEEILTGKYTQEQISAWATEQGCDTISEFARRWMIQRGPATYVFAEGRYLAPVPRENLFDSIKRDLARAPVDLYTTTKKGDVTPTPIPKLLELHSTVARTSEASLVLQRSNYDARTHVFNEACTPLRKVIQPVEHPEIHLWLKLLDPTEKLIDWVASVTRLDRYTCAIYLNTKPGTGKNLLAGGLARLWTRGGPSELDRILDNFNESLTSCPLIFADESVPKKKDMTAILRRLIGSTTRTLSRKYLPTCNLHGAIRLIIAGNNDRLLDSGEELSVNDLAAIADRFLYLDNGDKAEGFLKALGQDIVNKWVNCDQIAEHALYLNATHKFTEGKRFLVEGDATEFHRHLATSSGIAGLICEWITRYLANPMTNRYIHAGEHEVWINTDALCNQLAWERYLPSGRVPTAARIGQALSSLSFGKGALTVEGSDLSFFRIKAELLMTWIDRLQIGDTNAIRMKLAAPNAVIRTGGTL